MANRYPLVVDSINLNIKELPAGDDLNLLSSNIVNAATITANVFVGDGSQLSNVQVQASKAIALTFLFGA